MKQYKSHVLPTLEFCIPAVYHCTATVLDQVDRVQRRFLREVGLTEEQALNHHNLAPLQTRRDMAMLGLIHRTVLNEGPPQFQQWFFPDTRPKHSYNTKLQESKHNKQLSSYLTGRYTELLRRSPLGLVEVYNKLQQEVVNKTSVKAFQTELQNLVKREEVKGNGNWRNCLNLRRKTWRQRNA